MQRAQFILAHVTQMRMRNFFFIVTTANILRSYRTNVCVYEVLKGFLSQVS